VLGGLSIAGIAAGVFFSIVVLPQAISLSYGINEGPSASATSTDAAVFVPEEEKVLHIASREPLYGIYMSQCVVGTPSFRDSLVQFIDSTKLNAVVIDIKDYTGKISYTTDNPKLIHVVSDQCGATDMKEFIRVLHEKDIYVIGRVTVFQDPTFTKAHPEESVQSKSRPGEPWKDFKGLSFVSVTSRPFWDYIVELSKESYAIGFDELNYDYIRWPSDGPMSDVRYTSSNRAEEVEKFWKYLYENVKPTGAQMSADLFGMTTTNIDDLNIGQQLERALPYFDYILPMVYPSHYPKSFLGLGNPNSDPYRVVHHSMNEAVRRTVATSTKVETLSGLPIMKLVEVPPSGEVGTTTREERTGSYTKEVFPRLKMRPWLQDFDYGKDYTVEDIRAQIKATEDAGLTSWVFWDPGNKYEALRKVLKEETS
jgi:hypothetical protein